MRGLVAVAVVALLGGCAIGISDDGEHPSQTFSVPNGYQAAYRLADSQARKCRDNAIVTGNIYSDTKTAIVRVTVGSIGKDLERIEIKDTGNGTSQVAVTMWGSGIWDSAALAAVRETMETGKEVCRKPVYASK